MTAASERFVPVPTPETAPYWEKTAEGELWLPRCGACGTVVFYPRPACPHCQSEEINWFRASGRGTVESFVINRVPAPGYAAPYVIALVMLEEGVRLTSNLLGVDPVPDAISIGMPVEVEFEQRDGIALPQFRIAAGDGLSREEDA